ncbi:DUF3313 domain-containing protein [Bradyrhizobium sp. RDI18]|uniref:DUF3313 domain-containing protein n=1 Tax=Bradyrhizobium sp. RDI18 TaxID=3367400 RepID=UPI003711F33A
MAAGCATAPLERSGSLASYDNLTPSDGLLTKSQVRVSKADVLGAKTARIEPTAFTVAAAREPFSDQQRSLIKNAVNRAMCFALSERFRIVAPTEAADLSVRAVITHVAPTDATAAGVSKVASVVPSIVAPGVPIPVPRLPIGLGSLSVEAEARDRSGNQKAAMIWARGANSFTSAPRVSSDGDAYDLASAFGDDFGKFLVTAESPFGKVSAPPSIGSLKASLGGAPKEAICEAFGRAPGLPGMIGERIGLPPDWTDRGASANAVSEAPVTD